MTNAKTTKRALLSSVIALLLCCAMLVGTTFAWFTDSASTAVNKIQAGTLDVALEMKDAQGNWVPAENQTLSWVKADGSTEVLWEPGCTYVLPELRIVNKGNLALKYKIIITGIVGDAKLLEAIEFTYGDNIDITAEVSLAPNAATEGIVIKGQMKADAGNEYQGLSIDGISITVVATQVTAESDSFGNTYDTNATYLNTDAAGNILISSANELVYFAKTVNVDGNSYAGKTVKLTADIDLAGKNWIPIGPNADTANKFQGTFDGNGKTISNLTINTASAVKYQATGFFGALNGTAKNFTIDGATVTGISAPNTVGNTDNGIAVVAGSIYTSGSIEGVTVKNATVSGNRYVGGISGYTYGSVKNCAVENVQVTATPDNLTGSWDNGDKVGGVVGAFWHENAYEISGNTATNVTVTGYRDMGGIVGYANGNVMNNTVNGLTLIQDYSILTTPRTTVEAIVGRHDGYEVDASNTSANVTKYEQVSVATAEQLSSALNATYNADTIIKLANDIDLSGQVWGEHVLQGTNNTALTIDGNGKTISGLTSSEYKDINGFNSNGLVTSIKSSLSSVTFKNLTVSGANLTNNGGWNAASGVFVGDINTVKVTFDTCTVTGANVTSSAYAAGFVGYMQDVYATDPNLNCPITLKNCTVTNSTFNGGDATGALVGLNNGSTIIEGAIVTGNTINGGAGYSAAALVGTSIGGTTATGVNASGNTFAITNTTGYQVNNATYGYIYHFNNTYSVNGTALN